MNILDKIKNKILYPLCYSIISIQSLIARVKALGKSPIVHFEHPYAGQKILLLALYEKGRLRADIENLLVAAKSLGMYVLAVNTLKANQPDSLKDKIDCYIERANFGRDFGSYKTGFLHLYKKGWEQNCKRLLMLNDSLFYSKTNIKSFLDHMITTKIEVLGATENHEIEHHIGSFCISIDQSILQQTPFQRYWACYVNTDVRPKVIKRGEMKLSRILRRCVSSSDHFAAHFDLSWLINYLEKNKDILYSANEFYRISDAVDWKRPSLRNTSKRLINKYLQVESGLAIIDAKNEANTEQKISYFLNGQRISYFVDDVYKLIKAIETSVNGSNLESLKERVLEELRNDLLDCFSYGSQIHQNNILLHHLGMPLIKLDGLYRGMFSVADTLKLANQLNGQEKYEFLRLISSKAFGGNTLFGWKRAAFYRGLI